MTKSPLTEPVVESLEQYFSIDPLDEKIDEAIDKIIEKLRAESKNFLVKDAEPKKAKASPPANLSIDTLDL